MEALSLMPQTPCSGPRALDATGELRPDDAVDDREVPGCPSMRSVSVHLLASSDKYDKLQHCGCQEHDAQSLLQLEARQPASINVNDLTIAESVPSGGQDCQAPAVLSTQAPLFLCLGLRDGTDEDASQGYGMEDDMEATQVYDDGEDDDAEHHTARLREGQPVGVVASLSTK